jgi:hypothetical protein
MPTVRLLDVSVLATPQWSAAATVAGASVRVRPVPAEFVHDASFEASDDTTTDGGGDDGPRDEGGETHFLHGANNPGAAVLIPMWTPFS